MRLEFLAVTESSGAVKGYGCRPPGGAPMYICICIVSALFSCGNIFCEALNSIERYWAGLEKSWNGYFLESVTTVINRARNFAWRGISAIAMLIDTVYQKGIRLCGKEKKNLEKRLMRSKELQWWDISISSKTVFL